MICVNRDNHRVLEGVSFCAVDLVCVAICRFMTEGYLRDEKEQVYEVFTYLHFSFDI